MRIEISKMPNNALKMAALDIDGRGNKNNIIDKDEMLSFQIAASILLKRNRCTAKEIQTIFNPNTSSKTKITILLKELDSTDTSKKTPEKL
jgi:hypothetical protein